MHMSKLRASVGIFPKKSWAGSSPYSYRLATCHGFKKWLKAGWLPTVIRIQKPGWWLTYPSEKYEFISWDDEIPNVWKKSKCSKPPTSNRPLELANISNYSRTPISLLQKHRKLTSCGSHRCLPFTAENKFKISEELVLAIQFLVVTMEDSWLVDWWSTSPFIIYHVHLPNSIFQSMISIVLPTII